MHKKGGDEMTGKKEIRKVETDEIEGEYILKNTDPGKKKIIFSTVIWYDPEIGRYYFKSESDMSGNVHAGQVVSHKLIQDLLSISKWTLKSHEFSWDDPHACINPKCKGSREHNMKNREFYRKYKKRQEEARQTKKLKELNLAKPVAKQNIEKNMLGTPFDPKAVEEERKLQEEWRQEHFRYHRELGDATKLDERWEDVSDKDKEKWK